MRRIGIFGGTFNPIHNGHLYVAEETMRRMKLDRVIFVPSGQPPHKSESGAISRRHRSAMVRLAISSEPRFVLSMDEARRQGKSYSVETLKQLKTRYRGDDLFFMMGIDAFLDIGSWRHPDQLLALCHFVVVSRPGVLFSRVAKRRLPLGINPLVFSQLNARPWRKKTLHLPTGTRLILLNFPPCPFSSTRVRQVLRSRRSTKNFLPEVVRSYIIKNSLYL